MLKYYLKLSIIKARNSLLSYFLMTLAIALGIAVSMTMITLNYLMAKDPIPEKSTQLYHVQLFTYGEGHENNQTSDGYPYQLTYLDSNNIHRSTIPLRKTRSLKTGFSVTSSDPELRPFMTDARAIDSDFFSMFKVPFLFGSPWLKAIDEKPENVVVLTKELNNKLFKGENSVGRTLVFDQHNFTVVGVLEHWEPAPNFYDLNNGHFGEIEGAFVPFSLLPVLELPSWGNNNGWKTEHVSSYQEKLRSEILWLQYWVELPTDNTKAGYQSFLNSYIEEQKGSGRFGNERAGATLRNVKQWLDYNQVVDQDVSVLLVLAFMFLVVCIINTVAMLLSKFLQRAPEVGVRRALGASSWQIFYQHIIDVSLVGFGGCLVGLLLGQIGLNAVANLYPDYRQLVNMDYTLIFFAVILSLAASFLSGLYPAWKICRTNPSLFLKLQ